MKEQINISAEVSFIWETAEIIRDTYKKHQSQDIILPFVVLRRIESVLLEERNKVEKLLGNSLSKLSPSDAKNIMSKKVQASISFDNSSKFTFKILASEKDTAIKENFKSYVNGFTDNIKKILDNFGILKELNKLEKDKLIYPLIKQYAELDLSPSVVSNQKMGYIFEEVIRRFSEQTGEEAGEHFTPREIIELMVDILIDGDKIKGGELKTIYDPACGTDGMLVIGKDHILDKVNPKANVVLYGQEKQPETWAVGASDMLLKGENPDNIKYGNTLTNDQFPNETFDYMLSNPPFGVKWKKDKQDILDDTSGRFHKDMLPTIRDGAFLFLLHMISKMKPPQEGGSSIAIVFNGSPGFNGDAGSGESKIRQYLIANDLIEAIIGLPKDLFYNTNIGTYVWVLRNKKSNERKGKIQLVNAVEFSEKMPKSLGKKTKYISDKQIKQICLIYNSFKESEHCKIFDTIDFGYTKVHLELTDVNEDGNPKKETVIKKIKGQKREVTQNVKISD
ncbi:SAM-dependent DNA methyltransferase, partial [archaeon]|nr:SAM-dependent DNA methyltransferase [archaeon]